MTTTIPLSQIRRDGGTQTRASLNYQTTQDYLASFLEGATFPPIVVFYDGTDYWLADGFHRVEAARQAGITELAATVATGTQRDAVLHAAGANAAHGLQRTIADKRRAVELLLRDSEWGQWSDREIAKRCHVSHTFVASMRPHTGNVASAERLYTRNGQTQTMETAEIGKTRFSIFECGVCGKQMAVRTLGGAYECRGCGSTWPDSSSFMTAHHKWGEGQRGETAVSDPKTEENDALPATVWLLQSTMAGWFIPDWSAQDKLNFVNTALRGPGPARDDLKTRIKHLNYREEDVVTALENLAEIYQGQIAARIRNANQIEQNQQIAADAIAKRGKHAEWLDEQLEAIDDEVEEMLEEKAESATDKQRPLPPPGYLPYENRACPSGCEKNMTWQPATYQVETESWSRYQTGICNVCGCQLWSDYVWPFAFYYNPQTAVTKPSKTLMEAFTPKTITLDDAAELVASELERGNQKVWFALLSKVRKYPFSVDMTLWQIQVYLAKFLLGNTLGDADAMPGKLAEWGIEEETIDFFRQP